MKEIGSAISTILIVAMWISLFFLFWGDPDVYDKLHDKAMQSQSCNGEGGTK